MEKSRLREADSEAQSRQNKHFATRRAKIRKQPSNNSFISGTRSSVRCSPTATNQR